jgi:hypothetical protein
MLPFDSPPLCVSLQSKQALSVSSVSENYLALGYPFLLFSVTKGSPAKDLSSLAWLMGEGRVEITDL